MTANPVSIIKGRRQRPALRVISIGAWVLAGIGALSHGGWFFAAGVSAITLVVATPLLRVGWLILRWCQERDWRFAWMGMALLAVIAMAGLVALAGR